MDIEKIDILMVEDDPGTCHLVKLILAKRQQQGEFVVESAGSLVEGLDALARRRFDLVLLDLGLPDSRGLMTVEKVHQACPHIPIVVLTALEDDEIGVQAIAKGASDYLVKGNFNRDELARTIRYSFERKKLEHKLLAGEERLRAIVDNLQTGIILIDAENHIITDVNRAAAEMIGTAELRIIGQICHGNICLAPKGQCPITDLGQDLSNSEQVLLTVDGSKSPILKTAVSIVLGGRKYLLENFVDISERNRAEAELQKNTEQLERFNRQAAEHQQQMTELKNQINALLAELGREEKYKSAGPEEPINDSTIKEAEK